jgi:succinate dehydrogenase / fumarate reductase cytochrome b subunit
VLKPALDRTPLSIRAPFLRSLFTWSGVAPLGAFLFVHLAVNLAAIRGDASFARAVHVVTRLPALWLFEGLVVFLPLFFHGGVGLYLAVTRTPLAERSPYSVTLRTAMRVTGVVAFAFVAMHLPELRFRVRGVHLGAGELETLLGEDLSSLSHGVPWQGIAYLVGTGCVTFHFAAGLWACLAQGRVGGAAASRRWLAWGAGALGALVWSLLADIVVFHATGSRLFGAHESIEAGLGTQDPCPPATAKEP